MRKHYLDNLRTMVILLLFLYHTFMIWNNFGSKFYIWGGNNAFLSSCIVLVSSWLMPLLFVIAGISARYSLQKRSTMTFIKERIIRLLIPLLFGIILLIPLQTYFARKFFYDCSDNIWEHYAYFFTHCSDLNGYDGMFSFGHLWFILYLLFISLLTLPLFRLVSLKKVEKFVNNANINFIFLLFLPIVLCHYIGNFGGQSIGKYTLLYLIGYFVFTDKIIDRLLDIKRIVLPMFLISETVLVISYFKFQTYDDIFVNFVGWIGILACIILGKLFLDKANQITNYFRKSSFSIYLLHQTILVIIGYYSLMLMKHIVLEVLVIILGSFVVTVLFYEIIHRIPILKKIIGVR